jgi:hypothetical protein
LRKSGLASAAAAALRRLTVFFGFILRLARFFGFTRPFAFEVTAMGFRL